MSPRASWRRRRPAPGWLPAIVALAAFSSPGAAAEEAAESPRAPAPAAESPSSAAEPAPTAPVALERLLKLPDSLDYSVPSRGGATRPEWRARFESVRTELAEERRGLAEAQEKLAKVAGSTDARQVGPGLPGVESSNDGPLDYRLRQEIRNHRDEIDRLERELRSLEVEADLASVPADWRGE